MQSVLIVALSIALLVSELSVFAQDTFKLSASRTWTIDEARHKAFAYASPFIDSNQFSGIDPDLIENREAIVSHRTNVSSRLINVFSDGFYSVSQNSSQNFIIYYSPEGHTENVTILDSTQSYPRTAANYILHNLGLIKSGQLIGVVIYKSSKESYGFSSDGTLSSHWVNNQCYRLDGSSCGIRTETKFGNFKTLRQESF